MREAPRPGRLEQLGLALLTGGAAVSTVPWGWAVLPVSLASLAWRVRRTSTRTLSAATIVVRLVLGAVALTAASFSIYPVLDDAQIARIGDVFGLVLLPLALVALFATPVVPPQAAALPLGLALLVVGLFDSGADLGLRTAIPALGLVVFLVASGPRLGPRFLGRRLARLALMFAAAGSLAFGIGRFLPWLQPMVEEASADLLNPSAARGGLSEASQLGDIASLSLSRTVALRVWGDPPRRLRGRVLTQFDGRTWRAARLPYRDTPAVDPARVPGTVAGWLSRVPGTTFGSTDLLDHPATGRLLVAPVGLGTGAVFVAPAPIRALRAEVSRVRRDRTGVFEPLYELPSSYAVLFAPAGTAVSASDDLATDPALLFVPPDTDPRIRRLAARLAEGSAGPEDRLTRTLQHLWSTYRYSLSAGAFQSTQPVAEFLFDKKQGWCEYFASAAALLLRLQGVPTRFVTGFSMDGATRVGDQSIVRESDAHAWVEVYLPGRGWVEADPTPASSYAAVHAEMDGELSRLVDAVRAAIADLVMAVRLGDLRRALPAIGRLVRSPAVLVPVGVIAALLWWRRRGRRTDSVPPPPAEDVDPQVAALLARVETLWAACGHARPPHRAPREHLDATAHRLPAESRDPSRAVVDCVYRARYAGLRAPDAEIERLRRSLEAIGA